MLQSSTVTVMYAIIYMYMYMYMYTCIHSICSIRVQVNSVSHNIRCYQVHEFACTCMCSAESVCVLPYPFC